MRQLGHLFLITFLLISVSSSSGKAGKGLVQATNPAQIPVPKNIIFFISDGMGFNHLRASNYYVYGKAGQQVFEQGDWLNLGQATFPAEIDIRGSDTIFAAGYNPRAASMDHRYVKSDYTDSGAAGTALSTGVKTYDGAIGLGVLGDTLVNVTQAAKALGKSTGLVSSVYLSHATPAAFAAHNNHRRNYKEIAQYLLFHTRLDLIMAPGNPDFNDNGNPARMDAQYIGGREIWEMLKTNDGRTEFATTDGNFRVQDTDGDGTANPWTVIQSRDEFLKLASGNTPSRVLGVPKVHQTLQQGRNASGNEITPFTTPVIETVPTLVEMTRAALNVLSKNPKGFFVMIEGGAVDWASHDNHSGRMIEEQIDYNNAVRAAVEWVEKYSSWEETLIIVTSDHECGYLTGPGEPNPLFPNVVNNGKGNLPGMAWHSRNHTNRLVPFFAKGKGKELFMLMADEKDPIYGRFIQNAEIPQSIFLMWGRPEIKIHRLN